MKNSSKILILAIFLVFICCVSAASAAENDNVTASGDELALEEVAADDVIDEQDTLASEEVDVDEVLSSDDDVYVAYVGQNTTENGDGSSENPFATLKLACDDANTKHRTNVTINIKEGTYYFGGQLDFDTDNLVINGEGNVIIKNLYNFDMNNYQMGSGDALYGEAFGLTSSFSNFTLSNLIFDASSHTTKFTDMDLYQMTGGSWKGKYNLISSHFMVKLH